MRPATLYKPPVLSLALLGLLAACGPTPSGRWSEPLDLSRDPVQEALADPVPFRIEKGGWTVTITPRASYAVRGIVLSVERYRFDRNALLSPCDVALAWGPLVEGGLYRKIRWDQSGRWYWWAYGGSFPYDNAFIARYSANTHIIPATPNVGKAAAALKRHRPAELRGYLVDVDAKRDGQSFWWHSSLSREDTGDGSCEVLFLEQVVSQGKVYR
ncbi:MAG: hypothetical protein ACP5VN_02535 [Acidobacteriota bacterium]